VQTLDQLLQVWAFVAPILDLPTGEHTLTYYTEQVAKTSRILVFAECGGRICGCILASSKDEHILVGPVAVAEDSRRSGIGRAMMQEIEKQAKEMGQTTLILGALEEAEPFYLSCGFQPNLFIQLPEPDSLERLKSLSEGHDVVWEAQRDGWSTLALRTPEISRSLQRKYEQGFPTCFTQYVFIKTL
jgi:GNAT superfamily N-acetyltransferase